MRKTKNDMIRFRVQSSEKVLWDKLAEAEGLTLSAWVVRLCREAAAPFGFGRVAPRRPLHPGGRPTTDSAAMDAASEYRALALEMAKVVLDEVAARLALIQELQAKTEDPSTDEVHELQPLFEKGLWIFGPEFETIHFTSNRGMTKVIRDLFGDKKGKGSLNRPDFAMTVDGTVGLYTYPEFDDEGGEVGIARLVILELKKPGIPISTDQKDQAWKYVKELRKKGYLTERTQVTCFVLGSEVDPVEAHARKEWEDRVVITPLLFDRVLKRAHSRTFKLYEKVHDALWVA